MPNPVANNDLTRRYCRKNSNKIGFQSEKMIKFVKVMGVTADYSNCFMAKDFSKMIREDLAVGRSNNRPFILSMKYLPFTNSRKRISIDQSGSDDSWCGIIVNCHQGRCILPIVKTGATFWWIASAVFRTALINVGNCRFLMDLRRIFSGWSGRLINPRYIICNAPCRFFKAACNWRGGALTKTLLNTNSRRLNFPQQLTKQ